VEPSVVKVIIPFDTVIVGNFVYQGRQLLVRGLSMSDADLAEMLAARE
jgi:hypothetical protein